MDNILLSIKIVVNFLLELIFPSRCLGCNIKHKILCDKCIDALEQINKTEHENIFALYDYKNPLIKKVIWNLKYYKQPFLGKKLGYLLYESFIEEINELKMFSSGSPIYVIPVPISKERIRIRGYNQTEIIAKSFCLSGGKNFLKFNNKIIYKNKDTISQARLTNKNKRLKNLIGAFSIKNSKEIKNKTIIIIDDVTTTGGTMLEIMKILNKSGAKKIIGLAVAH